MIDTDAGPTLNRWNRSRCIPSASARIALIVSPWLTAAHTAPAPCSSATAASCRRIADTARACMASSPSPPGNTTAEGWFCTVAHSGSFARSRSGRPCHWP
ncbi:hypothetical protein ACH61_03066 [Rathayibacter tanaceti]|uniref:Uncharacterized protein n=1 Tax=Rathayibacter tanaceti TaxID=1671680 RepID=A0A166H2V7_9MICO|nr:hypothetical protein ACH61_03066 [Rathayibacter tanaceti]